MLCEECWEYFSSSLCTSVLYVYVYQYVQYHAELIFEFNVKNETETAIIDNSYLQRQFPSPHNERDQFEFWRFINLHLPHHI